jgi:hypothetical protein
MKGTKPRDPRDLVRESRRTGSWDHVAMWLAASLNEIDASVRDGATARAERADLMWDRITRVGGDQREIDLVVLPDGTRVCWHLDRSRRSTGWVVERRGERCVFPLAAI